MKFTVKNPGSVCNYSIKSYPQHPSNHETSATTSFHAKEPDTTGAYLIGPIKPNILQLPKESVNILSKPDLPVDTYIWAGKEFPVHYSEDSTNHLNKSVKKKLVCKTSGRNLVPRQISNQKEILESKSFSATRKRIADKILSVILQIYIWKIKIKLR